MQLMQYVYHIICLNVDLYCLLFVTVISVVRGFVFISMGLFWTSVASLVSSIAGPLKSPRSFTALPHAFSASNAYSAAAAMTNDVPAKSLP